MLEAVLEKIKKLIFEMEIGLLMYFAKQQQQLIDILSTFFGEFAVRYFSMNGFWPWMEPISLIN